MDISQQRTYWPTTDWQEAGPQEIGMNPHVLSQMQIFIEEHLPGLHSLLIVRHGYLVFEAYYQGYSQKSYHSLASGTKSIISMLVGRALSLGLLHNLDQRLLEFFPDYASQEHDPRKQAITLHALLSMQAGFSTQIPDTIPLNPVQFAIERSMERQPGEQFFYDNWGASILSGILTRVTGKSAAAFADQTLFKTLGIWRDETARFTWRNDPQGVHTWHEYDRWDEQEGYLWKIDSQGNNTGAAGAHLTTREMAKLGYFYLNRGYWDGEQIVPENYVRDSTRKQSEGGPPINVPYGYLWWITQLGNASAFFATGFGGQRIYVVPAFDLVVAMTASPSRADKDPEQHNVLHALVPRFILPAIME